MAPAETINPGVQKKRGCSKSIDDGKSRQASNFKKRKSTLKNKASQLATLCDVRVCMVCLGPDGEVDAWPDNKTEVRNIISGYKRRISGKGKEKAKYKYNLLGFLESKKKKLEDKLNKGRGSEERKLRDNVGNMFSKWDAKLKQFSEEELVGLYDSLNSKLWNLRERIRLMQVKENEKAAVIPVYNGDTNKKITNTNNYVNTMNECYQTTPTVPLNQMLNGEFCYNQQVLAPAFGGTSWPREYCTVSRSSSSWGGNLDFGRRQNFGYLGVNYSNNIPVGVSVGDINDNFSSGFGDANTGFGTQENFGFGYMGESSGNTIGCLLQDQYSSFRFRGLCQSQRGDEEEYDSQCNFS
ncbi:Agamous-like MADS-box protein [Melia azedarach]|uniref:Agamous-like MADS-box protein n=1 Tax=Melia azedarach TaxID=155640 RepID=A0ACC1X9R4_MELAZ|nr:Agamous-like MADS-box protein [Melia azedarach]